jgi:hypothetical protein
VALGRYLDQDVVWCAGIGSDKSKPGVAAAHLAVDRVNNAAASTMNRMKFD